MSASIRYNFIAVLFLVTNKILACTGACVTMPDGSKVVVKAYDWKDREAYLIFNPKSVSKRALVLHDENPLKWQARYSSLTFVQYAIDHPSSGINSEGLVIETLASLDSESANPDEANPQLPVINSAQVAQFLLDHVASVEEIQDLISKEDFRLANLPAVPSFKLLVSDSSGQTVLLRPDGNHFAFEEMSQEGVATNYRGGPEENLPLPAVDPIPQNPCLNPEEKIQILRDVFDHISEPVDRAGVFGTQWQLAHFWSDGETQFRFATEPWKTIHLEKIFKKSWDRPQFVHLSRAERKIDHESFEVLDVSAYQELLAIPRSEIPMSLFGQISSDYFLGTYSR